LEVAVIASAVASIRRAAWRCSASPGANCPALRSDAACGRERGGEFSSRSSRAPARMNVHERYRGAGCRISSPGPVARGCAALLLGGSSAYPLLIYLSICRVAHRDGNRCTLFRARVPW